MYPIMQQVALRCHIEFVVDLSRLLSQCAMRVAMSPRSNTEHDSTAVGPSGRKQNNTYMGKNNTYMGKNNTCMGKNNTHMGKNNTYMGKNNTHMGKNNTHMGKNNTYMGKNNTYMGIQNYTVI